MTTALAQMMLRRVAVPAEHLEGWIERGQGAAEATVDVRAAARVSPFGAAAAVDVVEGQVREVGVAAAGTGAAVSLDHLPTEPVGVGLAVRSFLLRGHGRSLSAPKLKALLWTEGLVSGCGSGFDALAELLVVVVASFKACLSLGFLIGGQRGVLLAGVCLRPLSMLWIGCVSLIRVATCSRSAFLGVFGHSAKSYMLRPAEGVV